MAAIRIRDGAARRLDEIYRYTRERWGSNQAEAYISGLFEAFNGIASNKIQSKEIPAEFGVSGFYVRHEHHFVYWRHLSNGDIGIVTILHERMNQVDRLLGDLVTD